MGTYANEYKETLEIIKHLNTDDFEKIPIEYINYLQENCNHNHHFVYDTSKSFAEQDMLEGTKLLLFELFERFGTTEKQKVKINEYKTNYINRVEEEKRRRYNPDDVFKNNIKTNSTQITPIVEEVEEQQLQMVSYKEKESAWTKIKKWFKRKR